MTIIGKISDIINYFKSSSKDANKSKKLEPAELNTSTTDQEIQTADGATSAFNQAREGDDLATSVREYIAQYWNSLDPSVVGAANYASNAQNIMNKTGRIEEGFAQFIADKLFEQYPDKALNVPALIQVIKMLPFKVEILNLSYLKATQTQFEVHVRFDMKSAAFNDLCKQTGMDPEEMNTYLIGSFSKANLKVMDKPKLAYDYGQVVTFTDDGYAPDFFASKKMSANQAVDNLPFYTVNGAAVDMVLGQNIYFDFMFGNSLFGTTKSSGITKYPDQDTEKTDEKGSDSTPVPIPEEKKNEGENEGDFLPPPLFPNVPKDKGSGDNKAELIRDDSKKPKT